MSKRPKPKIEPVIKMSDILDSASGFMFMNAQHPDVRLFLKHLFNNRGIIYQVKTEDMMSNDQPTPAEGVPTPEATPEVAPEATPEEAPAEEVAPAEDAPAEEVKEEAPAEEEKAE